MMKQNPFSLYDFLGYLIPGSLFFYTLKFWFDRSKIDNVNNIISQTNDLQLDKAFFFIVVSYSLGHFINYLSSITVERFATLRYGYPSEYLLGYKKDNESNKFFTATRLIIITFIMPIVLFDIFFGKHLNFKAFYTKELEIFLKDIIIQKSKKLICRLTGNCSEEFLNFDFHRILSHYVYENSKNHQYRLTNYVALYGFLRSLTLITNFIFWIYVYLKLNSIYHYHSEEFDWYAIPNLVVLGFLSYVFFMGFMKFYRRYTLETLMLIIVQPEDEKIN